MANYITPPAQFPIDVALELFDVVKSGDLSDNRIPAGALTLAAYGTKVTVGWPGEFNAPPLPERMDHVSEEDYRKVEELRDLVQAQDANAPVGMEAFKFGDGTLLKLLGPLLISALNAWLAGRTTG